MFILKRAVHQYELKKCDVSGKKILFGDWYYEDDVTGQLIEAHVYKDMKNQKKEEEFDYEEVAQLASQTEYRDALKRYEKYIVTQNTLIDNNLL